MSVPRALINTLVKTTGELDFGDIFNQGNLLFPFIAYFLFVLFVIIMPVLFSNLLVSKQSQLSCMKCEENKIIRQVLIVKHSVIRQLL